MYSCAVERRVGVEMHSFSGLSAAGQMLWAPAAWIRDWTFNLFTVAALLRAVIVCREL